MEGEFPPKAKTMVKEFIMNYQKELYAITDSWRQRWRCRWTI